MYSLYKGDCIDIMRSKINAKSIDLILTDLPYGQTHNKWDHQIPLDMLWEQFVRITKDSAAIILFTSGMFTADVMQSNRRMWRYNLVYQKRQPSGFLNARKMPLRTHEDICVFYKKAPVYNTQFTTAPRKQSRGGALGTNYGALPYRVGYDSTFRYPTSVLTFSKDTQKTAYHPPQKPVALLEWIIKTYSNNGGVVLDCCMGSGSIGVAALKTNRRFIGIEIEEKYYQCAEKWIKSIETNDNKEE